MKTIDIKSWRKTNTVLLEPLSVKEQVENVNKSGFITVKLLVDLSDVLYNDIESLHDTVSERITGTPFGLTDISYSVAGSSGDQLILKVTGAVET